MIIIYYIYDNIYMAILWTQKLWPPWALHKGFKTLYLDFPGGPAVKTLPDEQATRVRSLVQRDPTGCRAAEPTHDHYWALPPGACARQREGPPQRAARGPQGRVKLSLTAVGRTLNPAPKTQHSHKEINITLSLTFKLKSWVLEIS